MSGSECVLCRQSTDDEVKFGKKYTCKGVTAHYYCLLLTSNLVQRGDDDDGINGFLPSDVKSEVNRASKLFCAYCKEKTATIGCCVRACRKSFHLPCALKNECRLEFTDPFKSFCDVHNGVKKPKIVHKPTDLCSICFDDMGEWDPIQSIQSPCCNRNSWYHKLCLMKYAQTSGYFLKCPLCNDSDQFRDSISKQGVFIPDRDAQWEETGPDAFYDFQQHSERPSNCEARKCICSRGRDYESPEENDKHAFIYCHYCGGHSVHRGCNMGEIFLCEECSTVRHDITETEVIDLTAQPAQSAQPITNSIRSIYNNRIRDGNRKENVMAIIELSDSDEDYVATYSETTAESKTISVTRTTVCVPLRQCAVRIPRIDVTQLVDSSTKESSDNGMVFNVSNDSALPGDVSMEYTSQGSDGGRYSGNDVEMAAVRNVDTSFISSETDEDTKSADEGERLSSPIPRNYSNSNSDGFDVNDNSKKVFSSNMIPFSYKEPKSEIRSESSGIESISSFHSSSESSSSEDIQKLNELSEHRSNKVHRSSDSSDSSITSTSSSSSSSSSASSSSISSMSSSTETITSYSIQSKESSDGEQSGSELHLAIANQPNLYAVKEEKVTIKTELNDSLSSDIGSSSSPINKRKRRTIKHFFGEASTSDDDVIEVEVKTPKRKVAKRSPKSAQSRESNQRSITEMFIKLESSF